MFKVLLGVFVASLVLVEAYAAKSKAGPVCELCTLVLTAAKSELSKNQTDDQIIHFIETNLCGRLGPLNATCVSLMESEGRQILADLASGLDPATVCKKFGLCSAEKLSYDVLIADKSTLNCTICKLVMTQIENLLNGNQTQAQIINYLETHFCKLLGPLSSICDTFVEKYGPEAIALLTQKIDPEKACEIIGMCTNKTSIATERIQRKLDRMHNRKNERAGPVCELCTLVLTAAKSELQKNQTDDQIIKFIEKDLCGRLGPLNGTCVNLVETEGRQILADLASGLDPATVCKKFGLCSAGSRHTMKMNILDPNPIECTVCQYVIQFLDVELKGNKTEAAIVSALKNVCKLTPASLRDKCDSLVGTYGVYLVQLLMEFADPLKVCQAIKVC